MSSQVERRDVTRVQGDQLVLTGTLRDGAGDPVNLTGWTIVGRVGSREDPDVINATVTVVSAAAGTFEVEWSSTDTAALTPNQGYTYNIKADDGADLVQTIGWGVITVANSLYF